MHLILFMPDELRADAWAALAILWPLCPTLTSLLQKARASPTAMRNIPSAAPPAAVCSPAGPPTCADTAACFIFLRPEEPNLFRYLRQSGYDVFWFGKMMLLPRSRFTTA